MRREKLSLRRERLGKSPGHSRLDVGRASIGIIVALLLILAIPGPALLRAHASSGPAGEGERQRFEGVVRQSLEISCGAAALATILRYHHGLSVTERDVIETIFAERQRQGRPLDEGFSLLELLRAARAYGVEGRGLRVVESPEAFLRGLRVPILVHIVRLEYSHFVVIRGVSNGTVFVADPSLGNFRMTVQRFLEIWRDHPDTPGRRTFLTFQGPGSPSSLWLRFDEPFIPPELRLVRRR